MNPTFAAAAYTDLFEEETWMNCLSVCLSVCLYPLNVNMDIVETTLSKHFKTFKVQSKDELKPLLKKQHIFCIVIGCNVRKTEDIIKVRKICLATSKIPCLMYGQTSEQEFLFQLAKDGLDNFVTHGKLELLIEKLYHLKEQATFRIDLREFRIDLNQCKNYWTRKFFDFILKDFNFLKYHTVNEIANKIGTTSANLDVSLKKDLWISPKQILLCLRNYYAAYLFEKTNWSTKAIAEKCRFPNEREFYKSFRKKTGVTFLNFFREKNWQDFPTLYLENIKQKSREDNI